MYVFVTKLKHLKHTLSNWHRSKPSYQQKVENRRLLLDEAQAEFDKSQFSANLSSLIIARESLEQALEFELSILHQRSRLLHLNLQNMRSKYFYNAVKNREHQNKIKMIKLGDGSISEDPAIIEQSFVQHFETRFGGTSIFDGDPMGTFKFQHMQYPLRK